MKLLLRIHYERPERRIGLCRDATRAPVPGPRPGWGSEKHTGPQRKHTHWDWHQSDKSQGPGDGVPRLIFLLCSNSLRPFRSFLRYRPFAGLNVSAFNICKSLFR
jgi:hypothetical protein